jgi:23S rRNA pseudouridine1911/1915/1917 synthase
MLQTFTIPPHVRHSRADKALSLAFPEHSRVAFQRSFDDGLVLFEGKPIARDYKVVGGMTVTFSFPDVKAAELKAVAIPLDVIYEDKHLLAINKAAGMVVHPGAGTGEDTLVHALLAHCKGSLSGIGGVERPGIVHRLDRETSGIIIVAKTDRAHRGLAEQFSDRTVQKEYLALVSGAPELLSGSITKSIGRNQKHRHKMMVFNEEDDDEGGHARDAHTDWVVEKQFGKIATLVRCIIHTGRTHQIRVHVKSLGHIILGDEVYGWKPDRRLPVQPARVMLHAEHIVIVHPITGKTLDLRAAPPADFQAQLKQLAKLTRSADKKKRAAASTRKPRKPAPPPYHVHESRA